MINNQLKIVLIDVNPDGSTENSVFYDLITTFQPVGLLSIAAYLKQKLGDRVIIEIIHEAVEEKPFRYLSELRTDCNQVVVGIRGMTMFKARFHELAAVLKNVKKDIIIVGGGPYVTMSLPEAARDRNFDYFVIGEGEVTFTELAEKLLHNQDPSDSKGIAYVQNNRVVVNPPRPFIQNLDALPFPDYHSISLDKYKKFINYGFNQRRQGVIFSSRGCPFSCIYCHKLFGPKFRARSPRNIFQEIESLYKNFSIGDFYFLDDAFNFNYRRAMEIFDLIIKSGIKIRIYFRNGLCGDLVDREFIDKMVAAGTVCVSYAVETASLRLQKVIKKNLNLEKLAETIHYTCEKDIMVGYFAMVGFPTETKGEALQTIEYVKQFKRVVLPMLVTVKYYPSTEVFDLALKNGIDLNRMEDACADSYHDISHSGTPLISKDDFRSIFITFLHEVVFSKERLLNSIDIQKKVQSEEEMLNLFSAYLKKKVKNLEQDVLCFAH